MIVKFRGVDSIEDAEPFEGAELRIPLEERDPLPEGEYYQSDLIGCVVIERATGERIGHVKGWLEFGGPELLEVEPVSGGDPVLIPFSKSICVEIDPGGGKILVELPEGLKDLNR